MTSIYITSLHTCAHAAFLFSRAHSLPSHVHQLPTENQGAQRLFGSGSQLCGFGFWLGGLGAGLQNMFSACISFYLLL